VVIIKINLVLNQKNRASIIRGLKIGVTKNARKIHTDFKWQSRFQDHIRRNDAAFHKIRDYINNNPLHGRLISFMNGNKKNQPAR
tara:strand:- start:3138 stop:3392 length:255 start_codon:yes stop_codon:yes gene_type:complete